MSRKIRPLELTMRSAPTGRFLLLTSSFPKGTALALAHAEAVVAQPGRVMNSHTAGNRRNRLAATR